MKCALCGYEFSEQAGKIFCQGCLIKGCGLARCPKCNFENAAESGLLKSIKEVFKKWQ